MPHPGEQFSRVHRSFRSFPPRPLASLFSVALASALSFLILRYGATLLRVHEAIRSAILRWTGIPISGPLPVSVFGADPVAVPITAVANYQGRIWLLIAVSGAGAGMLLVAGYKVPLARSMAVLLGALLIVSTVQAGMRPQYGGDSSSFVGFWLHCELVVSILLPWVMALLAGIILPFWPAGIFWTLAAPAYGIVWSAARLAFCTSLLYFAGPVLTVLLWFSFGMLADLLFICCFYSIAVSQASALDPRATP